MSNQRENLILTSGLFDSATYADQSLIQGSAESLVSHYLTAGERSGLAPSRNFDPFFYRYIYSDLTHYEGNMLVHYLEFGKKEGRYPTRNHLEIDMSKIVSSNAFDELHFTGQYGESSLVNVNNIGRFLIDWRIYREPYPGFDAIFYWELYEDVRSQRVNPLLHYLETGRRQGRVTSREDYEAKYKVIASRVDDRHYCRQINAVPGDIDVTEHYLKSGSLLGLEPCGEFDPSYYRIRNSDVVERGVEPFFHWISYGKAEGRSGKFLLLSIFEKGGNDYDPSKRSIMICNHQASRSGAPLVGLNIARELSKRFNIFTVLAYPGELVDAFAALSFGLLTSIPDRVDMPYFLGDLVSHYKVAGAIINSSEVGHMAKAIAQAKLPCVSLVHEYANYVIDRAKIGSIAANSSAIIFPANDVKNAFLDLAGRENFDLRAKIMVRPQGPIPELPPLGRPGDLSTSQIDQILVGKNGKRRKLILGAGYVGIRKGVDLFIQTAAAAREIDPEVLFMWVGDGFNPTSDLHYSVWLADMIERYNLKENLVFISAQSSIFDLLNKCQVFFLSSRLDPFPNVIIDALTKHRPIVCFEKASGCADFFYEFGGAVSVVPYLDVRAAAETALDLTNRHSEPDDFDRALRKIGTFSDYVAVIVRELLHSTI